MAATKICSVMLSKKNCIDFALWLRDNDTQENAEQFFHFSDEGMFDYWAENILIKS